MKVKYKKPKGQRIKKQFLYITTDYDVWWLSVLRKWVKPGASGLNLDLQSHAPCRSVKAFKRHLKRNPVLRGNANLVSRFAGYDITG